MRLPSATALILTTTLAACAPVGTPLERGHLGIDAYGTTANPVPVLVTPLRWIDGPPMDLQGQGEEGRLPSPEDLAHLVGEDGGRFTDEMDEGFLYADDVYVAWVDEFGGLAFTVRPDVYEVALETTQAGAGIAVAIPIVLGTAEVIDLVFGTTLVVTFVAVVKTHQQEIANSTNYFLGALTGWIVRTGSRAQSESLTRAAPVPCPPLGPPTPSVAVPLARAGVGYARVCQSAGVGQTDRSFIDYKNLPPQLSRLVVVNVGAEPMIAHWLIGPGLGSWGPDTVIPPSPVPAVLMLPHPEGQLVFRTTPEIRIGFFGSGL